MANGEELDRISGELQLQQARGEAIKQQMQQMQNAIIDNASAIEAVQSLGKAKGDVLVPIGGGAFLSCPKPDTSRVVINIGAGVMVSRKPEDAARLLEDRQKKITEAMTAAQKDIAEVVRAMDALTQRASALAAEEERNVRPSKE